MLDNFRVSDWLWGAALALVCHSTWGKTPAPPYVSPAYTAALSNATTVCSTVSLGYAASIRSPRSNGLLFTYGIAPVAGVPYSAVGVTDSATTFVDGNRITRRETTSFFRDRQGRTRVEHAPSPADAMWRGVAMPTIILINDPVRGECYVLDTLQKIAHVFSNPKNRGVMHPPIELGVPAARLVMPGLESADGAGLALTANYASPEDQVSLGDKTIDGIPVVGTRLKHRVRTGDFGNEQPILVTVEYWFSRDLGIAIEDTQHTTIGGEINYRLQQITQSEPDPTLFQVPPAYTRKLEETPTFRVHVSAQTPKVDFVPPTPTPPPPPPLLRPYAPAP